MKLHRRNSNGINICNLLIDHLSLRQNLLNIKTRERKQHTDTHQFECKQIYWIVCSVFSHWKNGWNILQFGNQTFKIMWPICSIPLFSSSNVYGCVCVCSYFRAVFRSTVFNSICRDCNQEMFWFIHLQMKKNR